MRIQFCGADRTVTGSCHLLEINGLRIFLDAGLYQGHREEARRINRYLPRDAQSADAIILSHGHLDHCGKLPVFVKSGFKGPIYVTPASAEVARIVLSDAAEIQVEDASYLNRRMRDLDAEKVEPLYRPADIAPVLQQFKRIAYRQKVNLGNDVSFSFHDAGHILGSAYVIIDWIEAGKQRKLLFTADIGRYNTPIIHDPETLSGPVDLVITESTYGNTTHAPIEKVETQLLDAVRQCIQRKGRLIVPAFAVGRTQTILWYMRKFVEQKWIEPIDVFVDSPMGADVTRVHSAFADLFDEETQRMGESIKLFSGAHAILVSSRDQSKRVNRHDGPCVIIASSPTCEFGRIQHHLRVSVERENDLIVFVGWTPPNTLGRRLQEGQRRIRILDVWYDVKCEVRTIHGLSAHADGDELLRFLGPTLGPQTTAYIVHGEVPQAEGFARKLLAAGIGSAIVPAMETSVMMYDAGVVQESEPIRADAE